MTSNQAHPPGGIPPRRSSSKPTPKSSPNPETPPESPRHPPLTRQNTYRQRQNFLLEALETTTPLRHLASHSTLGSLHSQGSGKRSLRPDSFRTKGSSAFSRPLSSTFEEQRHEAKRGFSITKNTREWHPQPPPLPTTSPVPSNNKRLSSQSLADPWKPQSKRTESRTESGLSSQNYPQSYSDAPLFHGTKEDESEAAPSVVEKKEGAINDDGNVYPSTLGLSILIVGLCLSVFLISIDRTIITTVSCLKLKKEKKRGK